MKYGIVGRGRMAQAVEAAASARGHERVVSIGREGAGSLERSSDARSILAGVEIAFEFTEPNAAEANVIGLLSAGVPVVCGTTGWTPGPRMLEAIEASSVGIVLAPNFSPGMWVFARLVRQAGAELAHLDRHRPWVLEMHHAGKRDAPSGTALRIAAALLAVDGRLDRIVTGSGEGGIPEGALHVASVRAGDEPGTHTVGFDGPLDRITLTHRAAGREGFALGAVLAAEWLGSRRGLHGFDEVMESLAAAAPAGAGPSERGGPA